MALALPIGGCSKLAMLRNELNDSMWTRLCPLLPPERGRQGRPARDNRTLVSAILWVQRTGAPWRDLPPCYGIARGSAHECGALLDAAYTLDVALVELYAQCKALLYRIVSMLVKLAR